MKKWIFIFLHAVSFQMADAKPLDRSLQPDVRLVSEPWIWNETQGASILFEQGRQQVRYSGSYGLSCESDFFGKITFEILKQRLGFHFGSHREHHWVKQGAIGLGALLPVEIYQMNCPLDLNFYYSKALSKSLLSQVVPRKNEISDQRIAGSDAFHFSCGSFASLWDASTLSASVSYDFVKFKRHFQKDKIVQGPGIKLSLDQTFFNYWNINLGIDAKAPYIFYEATLSTQFHLRGSSLDLAVFGQRVHGLQSIPSSSRIGIELSIDFENLFSKNESCKEKSYFAAWLKTPAVYMPEVLVTQDHKLRIFNKAPEVIAEIGEINVQNGPFSFNVASYFTGGAPLIFSASSLPGSLVMNPISGIITGLVDGSITGSYAVSVKATNATGVALQTIMLHF